MPTPQPTTLLSLVRELDDDVHRVVAELRHGRKRLTGAFRGREAELIRQIATVAADESPPSDAA